KAKGLDGMADQSRFFTFSENAITYHDKAPEVQLSYNEDNVVDYIFNPDVGGYERFINDEPHIDEGTGDQLIIDNVIVVFTDSDFVDADNEEGLNGGKLLYYTNGSVEYGQWNVEPNTDDPIKFQNAHGYELFVEPGNVWVQFISNDRRDIV